MRPDATSRPVVTPPPAVSLRPVVKRCREQLGKGREKAFSLHRRGSPGMQVSNLLANLYDDVLLDVWHEAIAEHQEDAQLKNLSLVAHGGFGRRDLAPYSDADLMLLTTQSSETLAAKVAGSLTRDLTDCGITPGLSIRSPAEACSMAWNDAVVFSSLSESRLLAGSLHLYTKFFERYRQGALRRKKRLMKAVVTARREEREKWGGTNFLLRPNVKRSRGALRDIQLIRWLGFARFGETDLDRLVKLGALPEEDHQLLRQAYTFMLRVRHELHFRKGGSQDILDRGVQLEIAEEWGYEADEGVLAVEVFMQDYFEHTRNVRYAAGYFVDDGRSQSLLARVTDASISRRMGEGIRMGPLSIWVQADVLDSFVADLPRVMRLMSLANQHRRRISHKTWQAIRNAMRERTPSEPGNESIEAFLSLLSLPGRLSSLLRRLHELRIIEQMIPEFKRMRNLLQFNAYHKYTVDAHSFLAVEIATNLENDPGGMGRRYRRIDDKRLLHLALLIHDIGKGYEEDHCLVGERIAQKTAKRLHLDPADGETLAWLVRNHLAVNVIAFRHDLNDPQIVLSFAAEVGSIRRLELLVVHTYCDLKAVGPDVATDWKIGLIEDLYRRTRQYFDSGDLPGSPSHPAIESARAAVLKQLAESLAAEPDSKIDSISKVILGELPVSLLSWCHPESLSREIIAVAHHKMRGDHHTICLARFDESIKAMKYTIIRPDQARGEVAMSVHPDGSQDAMRRPLGTFARATGALSSRGLNIMRAQIETVGNYAWDYFWAIDPSVSAVDEDPQQQAFRFEQSCEQLQQLIDSPEQPLPRYKQTWKPADDNEPESVNVLPRKVMFDNDTVDQYTIISFFAYDQVGLLARIAAALSREQLVLTFAKIDTHVDQVADVFYVCELDGTKLLDPIRQEHVRRALLAEC